MPGSGARRSVDDACLHLCIAAGADFLITGDKDLLEMNPGRVALLSERLKIVTPRQFLETPEPGRSSELPQNGGNLK